MISGVKIKALKIWPDDRGYLYETLRKDDQFFKKFGQSNVTMAYPGVIKAFHWHKKQDDFWVCVKGMIQAVLYDLRPGSKTKGETQVICMGEQNPVLVYIPKGVAHGYRVLGPESAILVYYTSETYNSQKPDEERISHDDPKIGFDWETKNR